MATPTAPSLAYKLESWAIEILSEHELFPGVRAGSEDVLAGDDSVQAGSGFSIVHQEGEERQSINRIVCRASLGQRELGGPKPWNVTLEIHLLLTDRATSTVEDYVRAIEETFEEPPTVPSLTQFAYLNILSEEEEDKDTREDSRQRVKTYNFLAIEAGADTVPSDVLAGSEDVLAGSEDVLAGAETQ